MHGLFTSLATAAFFALTCGVALARAQPLTIGQILLVALVVLAGWQTNARGDAYQLKGRVYQVIEILGTTGSQCSYRRGGHTLATFTIPRRNAIGVAIEGAEVDLTTSREDITVRCRLRGHTPKSKVISYGSVEVILGLPPCTSSIEAEHRACLAAQTSAPRRVKAYPELVRMRFDAAD